MVPKFQRWLKETCNSPKKKKAPLEKLKEAMQWTTTLLPLPLTQSLWNKINEAKIENRTAGKSQPN